MEMGVAGEVSPAAAGEESEKTIGKTAVKTQ
jgi:hypothetical protein